MALEFEQVKHWVEILGPTVVGIGSTIDNTGVPIFYVAGMAVAFGVKAGTRPEWMWLAAFLGSVVGDLGVYAGGRYVLTKDKLLAGRLGQQMGPTLLAGERIVKKWGALSVIFGRFVPYVGKVLPFLAGSYGMSWLTATLAVVSGSFLLTGFYYLLGQFAVDLVTRQDRRIRIVSLAIGLIAIAGLWYTNSVLKKRNEEPIEL